ncbi:hypothetical protein PENTCL1PPCAC_1187, partial [Pristionchus entomophagus]
MASHRRTSRTPKPVFKKEVEEEEQDPVFEPSHFAKKLAELKELKKKHNSMRGERDLRESNVYKLETSFLKDFQDYQVAAVQAGVMKEEDLEPLGRLFTESSCSWLEALARLPKLDNDDADFSEYGGAEVVEQMPRGEVTDSAPDEVIGQESEA